MALFISESEADRKLNHEKNLIIKHKLVGHGQSSNGGRPLGGKNLSTELKALVGTVAKVSGVKATAEAFNISKNQVGAYRQGLKTDKSAPDPALRKLQEKNIEEIHEKVVDGILRSLNCITDEKVEEANYSALTKGASNLAGVLDKLREKDNSNNLTQQFVFFGVKPREEEAYNIIEVEATVNE
jgi:hypothetical protein